MAADFDFNGDTAGALAATEARLKGYKLATAEVLYHLPDHPALLQTFIWQHYDLAPRFPELRKFLDYWTAHIEAKLHSVRVARAALVSDADWRRADHWTRIH